MQIRTIIIKVTAHQSVKFVIILCTKLREFDYLQEGLIDRFYPNSLIVFAYKKYFVYITCCLDELIK